MNTSRLVESEKGSSRPIQYAIWIIAAIMLGTLLRDASTIFIWIACSFLLFALLDPTAQKLKDKGYSTVITSIALVLAATAITLGTVYLLGHFARGMIVELDDSRQIFLDYVKQIDQRWQSISQSLQHFVKTTAPTSAVGEPISKVEVVQSSPFTGELQTTLMHGLGSAVTVFTFVILCPILCFFLLAERDSLARVMLRSFRRPERGVEMWERIVQAIRAFFLGNLVLGLVTYPVFAGLMIAFGVPSAFTLAGLASFFNLIPFLGAVLAGFLPALTLLGQGDHVAASIGLYALCVLVHFAVANFVTPKVLGSKVDINATTSTIALIAWGEIWGGPGLIIAIPIMATIKIIFEYSSSERLRWFAALMSDNADKLIKPIVEPPIDEAAKPGR